jgi:hypothetical protein
MTRTTPLREIAGSILYLSSLLRDRARPIDAYVDYFGEYHAPRRVRRTAAGLRRARRATRTH